jgi:hypothetical protein
MPRWIVIVALGSLAGCGPGIHHGRHHHRYPPGALGGVMAVLDLTRAVAGAGVAVSRLSRAYTPAGTPSPPPFNHVGPLSGTVLWEGRTGEGIPGVRVRLSDDGGPFAEATTDRDGRFEFPVQLPFEGEYRFSIDDPSLRGSRRVWLGRGPATGLIVSARDRRPPVDEGDPETLR